MQYPLNGRIGDRIYGGDPVRNSNGECLLDFVKHAHLEIINCNSKCKGKITWFRHPHSSTIDYFLSSYITESHIIDMVIDEERLLNLGSENNMLMVICHKVVLKSVSYPKIVENTPILIEQSIACNVYT